jgi:hypothetical protein
MLRFSAEYGRALVLVAGEVTYTLRGRDIASANRWAVTGIAVQCRLLLYWGLLTGVCIVYEMTTSHDRFTWRAVPILFKWVFGLWATYQAFLLVYVTAVSHWTFSHRAVLQLPYTLKWGVSDFEWTSDRTRHAYTRPDIVRWTEWTDRFIIQTNDNVLWIIGKRFFKAADDVESLRNQLIGKNP